MLTIENKLKMKDLGGASRTKGKIYGAFDELKAALIADEFDFDSWGGLKIKTRKATDAEKIGQAFKVSLRRLYNFGIIEFDDTIDCNVIINDDKAFAEQIKYVGFKSADTYKKVLHKLGRTAFILAVNYEEEMDD